MQNQKKTLKIETGLLKDVSKLQEFQRLQTIKRIANLLPLSKLPEIRKLRDKLNSEDKKKPKVDSNPKTETLSINKITQCFKPPYTSGSGGLDSHPSSNEPHPFQILGLFNPFSSVDHISGEMSLSVISGQNYNDFYGGGRPFEFIHGILGNFRTQVGHFFQLVTLPVSNYETLVEIRAKAELPRWDVLELIPGYESSNLNGLVGAQGFIDISVRYNNVFNVGGGSSQFFLDAWKTGGISGSIVSYNPNPTCIYSFKLPAGVMQFTLQLTARIEAHSGVDSIPNTNTWDQNAVYNYALIDFRNKKFENIKKIRRHFVDNLTDHPAPGPIKIPEICVSYESLIPSIWPDGPDGR